MKPAYAFGHGLSYTSFSYALPPAPATPVVPTRVVHQMPGARGRGRVLAMIDFTLKNTGSLDGAEVAQLYTTFPASAGEPPRQLRNFTKVHLAAGESAHLSFAVSERDLSIWDVPSGTWTLVSGAHRLAVGAASDDLRLHVTVNIQ